MLRFWDRLYARKLRYLISRRLPKTDSPRITAVFGRQRTAKLASAVRGNSATKPCDAETLLLCHS